MHWIRTKACWGSLWMVIQHRTSNLCSEATSWSECTFSLDIYHTVKIKPLCLCCLFPQIEKTCSRKSHQIWFRPLLHQNMRNLTVWKSHRTPKPMRNPPVVSKSRSCSVSSKKYVRNVIRVQNKESTTNCVVDEADDVSKAEAYTKPVKDISMEIYILQKLVMLSGDSIITDNSFSKSVNSAIASLSLHTSFSVYRWASLSSLGCLWSRGQRTFHQTCVEAV